VGWAAAQGPPHEGRTACPVGAGAKAPADPLVAPMP